jgi:hypothetical protein
VSYKNPNLRCRNRNFRRSATNLAHGPKKNQ